MFALFDAPKVKRPRWRGRLEVEPPPRDVCPLCAGALGRSVSGDALALFWLHGYGAVVRTTHVTCPCGYRRHLVTETITPRGIA